MTELIARLAWGMVATGAAVVFLLTGTPLGAVATIALAVLIRRSVEARIHIHE
jgi:hypothetical protein